ncbi:hypothetical protein D9758_006042 [Tetrapyrgos nigripes]|uniref:Condensin complex subunit 2 n=1 Tax=Tetrapyrgos nigripes TaxID=182062 RepID=A0A8H5D9R2_9AGAR|nr:hypothetical protein D9758_006042 [Tetrapyrgos nigripes]
MARADRSQPLYDDEEEEGYNSEPETPKPHRSGIRKRLSEAHLQADTSFVSDSGARSINDDAAEKRKRRKSTKFAAVDNPQAGPSSEVNDADTSRTGKQKRQLKTVAAPLPESKEVMTINYEEWIKMATDNKINATNTWNVALIDYFHDTTLLRNDDNSINFQRASCTLDGCVKIWTSRVDSVGTETAKLANNLASGGSLDDNDEAGSDNPDEDPAEKKKKKAHRPGATLAKDPNQLRTKKLDLEFSVDPLFKKTCADFDEGGAQGLLMNHLSLGVGQDGGLRVVFDASDSASKVEEEVIDEPEDMIDLSQLRKEFFPELGILDGMAICHSLEDFSFSKNNSQDDMTFYQDNTQIDDDDDDGNDFDASHDMGMGVEDALVEDFFVGNDAVADDYGGGFDMMGGDDDNSSTGVPAGEAPAGQPGSGGPFVPFDPRRAPDQRDLVLAMTDENNGGTLDYFGEDFIRKNWAGPEHWKMRRPIRRPEGDADKAPKARREKKEPNKIDFMAPRDPEKSVDDIAKELFAPPGKGASINLPGYSSTKSKRKTKPKDKRDDHKLPDDMHFSSKQLITLFLKPKFALKMRGRRMQNNDAINGEVDAQFWAEAAAEQAAGRGGEDGDETADGGAIPFNTQFFNDDYDDGPGFDDIYDGDGVGNAAVDDEQDILTSTQGQSRRVKPEFVKYAKRAKRVDVRKLKENIWKGLDITVPAKKANENDDDMDVDDLEEPEATEPSEGRPFSSVISNLQKSYPRDKMEEISTSFCFICLLHLANEQGLKIQNDGIVGDEGFADTKVGDIWNLKVFRDPNAAVAA